MIEPVIERHTSDADAVIAHVGEIGQSQPTRRMLLPEDDVLLSPIQRPPAADAPLQGTADTEANLGMAAPDLVKKWPLAAGLVRSSTKAPPRYPKPQPADRDFGGRAVLSFATAAVDPVRCDRRWRR